MDELWERDEQRRIEHRQGVYHQFLIAAAKLTSTLHAARPAVTDGSIYDPEWDQVRNELSEVLQAARALLDGLRLFGSADVKLLAEHLDTTYFAQLETDMRIALLRGKAGLADLVANNLWDIESDPGVVNDWSKALWDLREAMRADVTS